MSVSLKYYGNVDENEMMNRIDSLCKVHSASWDSYPGYKRKGCKPHPHTLYFHPINDDPIDPNFQGLVEGLIDLVMQENRVDKFTIFKFGISDDHGDHYERIVHNYQDTSEMVKQMRGSMKLTAMRSSIQNAMITIV